MDEVISVKRIIQTVILPYLAACLPFCMYMVINKCRWYFDFSNPNSVYWYINALDVVFIESLVVLLYGWMYILPALLLGNLSYKYYFKDKGLIKGIIGFAIIGYVYVFLFWFFAEWSSTSNWNQIWKNALYVEGFHPFAILGSIAFYLVRRRFA